MNRDEPFIASSARRHGIADADMIHAFDNPVLVDHIDEDFTMLVGGDRAGNPLEIGVIDGGDGPVIVHAMTARPQYRRR
ncbi:MAG: hypothetical protein ACE5GB_05105 [Acidimicrobiales bacterium]